MNSASLPLSSRRDILAILCRASREELAEAWEGLSDPPAAELVRRPETGLVMARGRMGGGGAPFNFGEVTVTRCVVRLASGEVGFGHVLGAEPERAELVARFDALAQSPAHRPYVEDRLLAPLAERLQGEDEATRSRTAATRVSFFTMVRGEDD